MGKQKAVWKYVWIRVLFTTYEFITVILKLKKLEPATSDTPKTFHLCRTPRTEMSSERFSVTYLISWATSMADTVVIFLNVRKKKKFHPQKKKKKKKKKK